MNVVFWKMHGAGNDFILVHDRRGDFPDDRAVVRRLCDRRAGIGSEGLILLRPSEAAAFRMVFFNPDGSRGEMCGNGARCAARLARDLGLAEETMAFETDAGLVRAEIAGPNVRIHLPPPADWRMSIALEAAGRKFLCHSINTGVPHAVIEVESPAAVNLQELGPAIRHHPAFAPRGTNVDFMAVTAPDALRLRTYERGVEAETPACGTGSVACALVAGRLGKVTPPVRVSVAGGDVLVVDYSLAGGEAADVSLLGPAVHVFEGRVETGAAERAGMVDG